MAQTFTASVAGIVERTEAKLRYVAMMAIQDVVEAAQTPQPSVKRTRGRFEVGKIPVDTSELIQSLTATINGGATQRGQLSYTTVISGFALGDTLTFTWNAAHALPMELGFTARNGRQVPGRHFVGTNAAKFSEFVAQRVREVNTK
ncbi:MAG: hypothetical protein EBR82_40030 [Caulobacteraceae bacterium]|nr:hypothetical protein [Caulobacteraceae bacterium]